MIIIEELQKIKNEIPPGCKLIEFALDARTYYLLYEELQAKGTIIRVFGVPLSVTHLGGIRYKVYHPPGFKPKPEHGPAPEDYPGKRNYY